MPPTSAGSWLADPVPTVANPGGCWSPRSPSERTEIATWMSSQRGPTELDRYAALARTTGIIGIAFLVLLFRPIIALSVDEPPLDATAAEAVNNFRNLEPTWAQLTMAASTLGMIGSLWFFVAFSFLLRRAEGDPPWRSAIATLSGALLAAFGLIGVSSTYAASLHVGRITPGGRRLRICVRQRRG